MNDRELVSKIKLAQNGNMKATFDIILQFEGLINKESKINGYFNQDCKDYIIDNLIKNIKKFNNF